MKKRIYYTLCSCMIAVFLFANTAYAQEAQDTAINENEGIPVRIKLDVPPDFSSSVSIQYTGKETEGFSVTLSAQDNYITLIKLPADIYTYKQSGVPDAYSLSITKAFSLAGTNMNTYLLPAAINEKKEAGERSYISVKVNADFEDLVYEGKSITINYSGTDGNSIAFELSEGNNYTCEMSIERDLYTLKNVELSEGLAYDILYSFNAVDLNNQNPYELTVKILKQTEVNEPIKEEAVQSANHEVTFNAQVPNNTEFQGSIYISYVSGAARGVDIQLTAENNYTETMQVPAGRYELSYAVSYDTQQYTFSAQPSFTLDETSGFIEIIVYMLEDGKIVNENAGEVVAAEEDESNTDDERKGGFTWKQIFSIIVLAAIAIAGIIYFIIKKRKSYDEDYEEEVEIEENTKQQENKESEE